VSALDLAVALVLVLVLALVLALALVLVLALVLALGCGTDSVALHSLSLGASRFSLRNPPIAIGTLHHFAIRLGMRGRGRGL
jgi:hypothetical protein